MKKTANLLIIAWIFLIAFDFSGAITSYLSHNQLEAVWWGALFTYSVIRLRTWISV